MASTKAFTGQVMVLTFLAAAIAQLKGTKSPEEIEEIGRLSIDPIVCGGEEGALS